MTRRRRSAPGRSRSMRCRLRLLPPSDRPIAVPFASPRRLRHLYGYARPRCNRRQAGPELLGCQLVLGPQFEIAGVMAFVQLVRGIALQAVDDAPPLDGWTLADDVGPALDVLVVLHRQELAGAVQQSLGQAAVPRPHRDVGDGVG